MNESYKAMIYKNFNRVADSYDHNAALQRAVAKHAVHLLKKYQTNFAFIGDFACGTAESTKILIEQISFKECYALDFSEKLLAVAEKKLNTYGNIHYICQDFERKLVFPNKLNLIFCNMGLQWANHFSQSIALWQSYLCTTGLLLLTLPIAGNFPEIKKNYRKKLPSHKEILGVFSSRYWKILDNHEQNIPLQFENQKSLLQNLKANGSNLNTFSHNQKNKGLLVRWDDFFLSPNNSKLTYKIGTYLMEKRV